MLPLAVKLALVFVVGVCLGSLVNWAIYALAWAPRPISPWSAPAPGAARRRWSDRLPFVGWVALSRETVIHGPRFWVRPMLLELAMGGAVAALYWWEIGRLGLVQEQTLIPIAPPLGALHWQFASHVLLLCLMTAAAFIDIDEKIVPDDITVPGTLLGLLLAGLVPISQLPDVAERAAQPVVGVALQNAMGGAAMGVNGDPLWLEPVSPISPNAWPPAWGQPRSGWSLVIGLACYWLWCFALAPRIWRGRRGARFAIWLIARRVGREFARPPLQWLILAGTIAIVGVWCFGNASWAGLLTALVGMVGSGGIVWAVRLIGTAALRREAMGFGDVTFMMMVGTFLGWQACLIVFFLSPFAGLVIGILQFLLKRDDVIPYVPYLCLGSATTVVVWASIWNWAEPLFEIGWLVPAVLVVCLVMLGLILGIWGVIKSGMFPSRN
jgi:prepilin signal peptidase PulO-like enzyme (type II secretory pathway)